MGVWLVFNETRLDSMLKRLGLGCGKGFSRQ